ncbi:HTH domain-containing protein [Brevundimonas diminuta]|uniref:HTH domain-containing protein n=1 Tax=Brevundimonas diminuta TaxID=293 RepID=UPI00320AE7E4
MPSPLKSLRRRKDEIDREIASLQAERERVIRAIEALTAADLFDNVDDANQSKRRSPGTLKQMAYTVLREADGPMTANQIIETIALEFGQLIERTSMSPQLSRLAQDQFLKRTGNLWSIDGRRLTTGDTTYRLKAKRDLV